MTKTLRSLIIASLFAIGLLGSTSALANSFVVKSPTRHVAYTYTPGQPGAPTVLVFNGLLYMLSDFTPFQAELTRIGYAVVTMAYSTQPESIATLAGQTPAFMDTTQRPSLEDYADEAQSVLNAIGVHGQLVVMGLSYGGAPALTFARLWPTAVSEVILASPLAVPGDNYAMEQSILDQYLAYLNMFPMYGDVWANMTKENITQYYASTLVADPTNKFYPGVSKDYITQGLVAMIRAAEDFKILDVDFTLVPPVHFVLAGEEIPLRLQNQVDGYKKMVKQGRPGSLTVVKGAQHASTSSSPLDIAAAVDRAIRSGAAGVYSIDPANHVPVLLNTADQQSLFSEIKKQSTQPQTLDPSTMPTTGNTL